MHIGKNSKYISSQVINCNKNLKNLQIYQLLFLHFLSSFYFITLYYFLLCSFHLFNKCNKYNINRAKVK